ncbi:hypothetical protein NL676_027792 [Syzygium grande]|nr:hypothetical protein NL676_027792 [Syzygium grande]
MPESRTRMWLEEATGEDIIVLRPFYWHRSDASRGGARDKLQHYDCHFAGLCDVEFNEITPLKVEPSG